jgi:uncharacterized protein
MADVEKDFLGVGIASSFDWLEYEDSIRESMIVILSTSPGERLMRPDFGCYGLKGLVLSGLDSYTLGIIKNNIKAALTKWEPRVGNLNIEISYDSSGGNLSVQISYTIISANKRSNLVYPFYLEGATL